MSDDPIVLVPGDLYCIAGITQAWLAVHEINPNSTYRVTVYPACGEAVVEEFGVDDHGGFLMTPEHDVVRLPLRTIRLRAPLPSAALATALIKVRGSVYAAAK